MPKSQNSGMSSRTPLARMLHIHNWVQSEKSPNATTLSKDLEVSSKTIQRDIRFMRDQLGLPIDFDSAENGYYYTKDVDAFPMVHVSESELFALLVSQKALEAYQGTPYQEPLESALNKLSQGLKDKVFLSLDHLNTPVSFKAGGLSKANMDVFQKVSHALSHNEELSFEYKKIGSDAWHLRKMQPWHLCCVENQWYVISWDLDRQARRTFALVRMRNLNTTGDHFDPPEDFDIQDHLKHAFGVFSSEHTQDVRVVFDRFASPLIQEKEWHPSQEVIDRGDAGIEIRLKVSALYEIERWILSWGRHATVLEPQELKERIQEHARGILEKA